MRFTRWLWTTWQHIKHDSSKCCMVNGGDCAGKLKVAIRRSQNRTCRVEYFELYYAILMVVQQLDPNDLLLSARGTVVIMVVICAVHTCAGRPAFLSTMFVFPPNSLLARDRTVPCAFAADALSAYRRHVKWLRPR